MNKKDEAVAVMQEYFPNGGRDYDDICNLYDAIKEGKIPHMTAAGLSDVEYLIKPIMKHLSEFYNPHTKIVIDSSSAELVLKSSAEIARLSETISHEDSELEVLKESVAALMAEKEQERAWIASIQHAIADSNHAQAEAIRQLAIDMQRSRSGFC